MHVDMSKMFEASNKCAMEADTPHSYISQSPRGFLLMKNFML